VADDQLLVADDARGGLDEGIADAGVRIDCTQRSFQVGEEHQFSLPMGGGCYLGGMGSFWDGRALARRHPPGWNEDIVPGTPAGLAASRVCTPP
jgi:hypothetical protein